MFIKYPQMTDLTASKEIKLNRTNKIIFIIHNSGKTYMKRLNSF